MSAIEATRENSAFCECLKENIESLNHGKKAMILTAVTIVALAALAISVLLLSVPLFLTFSVVVLTSTLILGPKVFTSYIPDLCKMIIGFAKGQPKIEADGTWKGEHVKHAHFFDHQLCQELSHFFAEEGARSVADFGCGTGEYVQEIRKVNQIDFDGFDGNPDTPALSNGTCQVQNLAVPFQLPRRYDWVMSLETGEHLPKEYETIFIDNLIAHADQGIVLSWAKKGQGGHGHVNEQNNDYIKAIFQQKGWVNDVAAENRLRNASYPIYFWFHDTIMVFRKP